MREPSAAVGREVPVKEPSRAELPSGRMSITRKVAELSVLKDRKSQRRTLPGLGRVMVLVQGPAS